MKKLGLYLHIPFCIKKCQYCGFLSMAGCSAFEMGKYVEKLEQEIILSHQRLAKTHEVDTIFIGGGTPTILEEGAIKRLLDATKEWRTEDCEITIEGNPKTFTREKLGEYRGAGVNRLSIGLQSMNPETLDRLGRAHDVKDFYHSYEMAREEGFENINVDLMFALPGQTMDMWVDTLEKSIELDPEHISFYSLQIEEGTPIYDMYKNDWLDVPGDEIEREMHHKAMNLLKEASYQHYEISNAAKPGFQCRHNLKYWSMEEYLGLGLGASSFMEGQRFVETDKLEEYPLIKERQVQSNKDLAGEYVFTGLRKKEGINLEDFQGYIGCNFWEFYRDIREDIEKNIDQGNLILHKSPEGKETLSLSEKGIDLSNWIMADFV